MSNKTRVLALLAIAPLTMLHGHAQSSGGGLTGGFDPVNCDDTGSYTLTGQGLEVPGTSTTSYDAAGDAALDALAASIFECVKEDCEVGCNLGPRVGIEDASGQPVDVGEPETSPYWEVEFEDGLYSAYLSLPASFVLIGSCSECRSEG